MWIHILIFMVILGVFLAGKMGRLPPEAGNPEEKKLFIRIALTGNIIGMLLTFQSGEIRFIIRIPYGKRGDRCL